MHMLRLHVILVRAADAADGVTRRSQVKPEYRGRNEEAS